MEDNDSASDSTSSTLTINSVVDADSKSKDDDATPTSEKSEAIDTTTPEKKHHVSAQKLSDEVQKVGFHHWRFLNLPNCQKYN